MLNLCLWGMTIMEMILSGYERINGDIQLATYHAVVAVLFAVVAIGD